MTALLTLLLLGCPTDDTVEAADWWTGPGAGATSDDDDDDAANDDDSFDLEDIVVVGLDDGTEMRLVGYQRGGSDITEVKLESLPINTRVQAAGGIFFALTGGTDSRVTIGRFDPAYTSTSNPLPANSDPSQFVLGETCSLMVMQGSGTALLVPEEENKQPFFADLSSYADPDGDPDALSGARFGKRLFVGLARIGANGPDPDGGLAVELDCEANVLETQPLGPGALLASGPFKASLGASLLADGTVRRFDPDAPDWEGDVLWDGEDIEHLAVTDGGSLWAVAGSRLLCREGDGAPVELADDLGSVADLAVSVSGQACVVTPDELRCFPGFGCESSGGWTVDLDTAGLQVAVVTPGAE